MNNQNEIIQLVKETIAEQKKPKSLMWPKFTDHSPMYVLTTENLAAYLKKLKIDGKSVLTVTGSGDQLINLMLMSATKVDNFDSNKNAYYITALKLSAIMALSLEEYLNFFTSCESKEIIHVGLMTSRKEVGENPLYFSFETYQKIRPYMNADVLLYWDYMYQEYSGNLKQADVITGCDRKTAIKNNAYLQSEKNYEKVRNHMYETEINFYNLDILKIHTLPNKYDLVMLSNIYEYLTDEHYDVLDSESFVDYTTNGISNILNEGATVAIAYQYNYLIKNHVQKKSLRDLFKKNYVLEKREALERPDIRKILVSPIIKEYSNSGYKDCLYLYDKKR